MQTLQIFLVALVLGLACQNVSSYDWVRHVVVRTSTVATEDQLLYLNELQNSNNDLDFWTDPHIGGGTDIMVDEYDLPKLAELLNQVGLGHTVMIEDVEDVIAEQEIERRMYANAMKPKNIDWNSYYDLPEIEDWLASLQETYPNFVSVISIGKSSEGRDVNVVRIRSPLGPEEKSAVFITSTIHAREWIAASTATYMINQLTSNMTSYIDMLYNVEFYILPIINPDGYTYSHNNQRLWRKTRAVNGESSCLGVDANRNFGFKWGEADVSGSSGEPCAETYRGPTPFSTPEAAAVNEFITSNSEVDWKVYLTIHSYGQYFLCPWGYTRTLPGEYDAMKDLSDRAAAALTAMHGTQYQVGSSANVLYYTDGTDQDWAYGEGIFDYSYTMELRDTGRYGFLLPAEQIIPTAEETWAAVQVLARHFN